MPERFVCALCHRDLEKGRSDEEADHEYRERMDEEYASGAATAVVCDDCYGWMYDPNGRVQREHFGQSPPWTVRASS